MLLSKLFKYQLFSWLECTNITEASTGFIKNKLRILFWNKVTTFIIPGIQTKIYLKSFGFPNKSQQLCFVPNSVDSEFQITKSELIKKFNPENDIINFYFSGSLILRKGIDLLLEALKIVNSEYKGGRSYKLHILGAGDLDLEQIDNIIYHGFKTGYDYLNIIKKSQVFILPSRSDCNPLTVIEALKNGCILILSKNVGNASDYIQDNGFILESLTARNISEKMIIILECSFEQIRKMSYCSYEFGKNITHKNSAKSFISIMKQNIY
jgi:glycosyltransferase involved in cell wall biosynthesis